MVSNSKAAWHYRAYDPDTPPEAFGPLAPIVSLWQSKRSTAGGFPRWSDFNIQEFEGWWGQLSLAEIHHNPFDARWVLWGTKLVDWWGLEYTNQLISQQPYLGDTWEKVERPYLETLHSNRLVGFVSGTLEPQGREYHRIDGVDLPLEKEGSITHILSAYRLCDSDDFFVTNASAIFTFE